LRRGATTFLTEARHVRQHEPADPAAAVVDSLRAHHALPLRLARNSVVPSTEEGAMRRRTAGIVILAAAAVLALGPAAASRASTQATAAPAAAVPGVLGVDHFGITVPDVAAARDWLVNVIGCVAPLQFGPFFDPTGNLMTHLVGVHPRAVIQQINELRCGANGANLELFQYTAPDQKKRTPLNSDWAGNHFAVYVTDIGAATRAMRGLAMPFLGPFPVTGGPAAGESINYYLPSLGHYLELISYPNGMAYEATAPVPLWSPRLPFR
jgi:catechol 2,3-dioxygenase-like lactoylglutathione lyase family enzyme